MDLAVKLLAIVAAVAALNFFHYNPSLRMRVYCQEAFSPETFARLYGAPPPRSLTPFVRGDRTAALAPGYSIVLQSEANVSFPSGSSLETCTDVVPPARVALASKGGTLRVGPVEIPAKKAELLIGADNPFDQQTTRSAATWAILLATDKSIPADQLETALYAMDGSLYVSARVVVSNSGQGTATGVVVSPPRFWVASGPRPSGVSLNPGESRAFSFRTDSWLDYSISQGFLGQSTTNSPASAPFRVSSGSANTVNPGMLVALAAVLLGVVWLPVVIRDILAVPRPDQH
jgi:hypothetical protein